MRSTLFSLLLVFASTVALAGSQDAITYIKTATAAKPLGPYSQAVTVDLAKGKLIFIAGQVANDPKTGKFYEDDIKIATQKTFQNIENILKAAGSDLQHIVRTDVFLKNMEDWAGMNEAYTKFFPTKRFPPRQTVQVGMKNRIEISCIAVVPNQ